MAQIVLQDSQAFSEQFIASYFQRGFGTMTKGELETLIFHLLRRDDSFREKSIFELSRTLQIPETKVRKLIYESDLRYHNISDDEVKEKFFQCLRKAQFQSSNNNKVEFPLDDKLVRSAIDDKLKSMGHFSDTSHNRDVFSISITALTDLIYDYMPEECKAEVNDKCKDIIRDQKIADFKSLIMEFLRGASYKSGEVLASSVFAALSEGLSTVTSLIPTIRKVFINNKQS